MVNAYMYGIDCNNSTSYLLVMMDRVHLCYTQMRAGIYIDEGTVHIVSQKGDVYTLSAILYCGIEIMEN